MQVAISAGAVDKDTVDRVITGHTAVARLAEVLAVRTVLPVSPTRAATLRREQPLVAHPATSEPVVSRFDQRAEKSIES
jgi:hypothetical protein